jgi:hypothetical protein
MWTVLVSNPQKNKGDKFERDTITYLREHGFGVDRTRAGWSDDRGDIHGVDGFTWECKNWRTISLPLWIRELETECVNNGTELGAVVHKKRGTTDMGEQYATLPLRMLVQLLKEAGYK